MTYNQADFIGQAIDSVLSQKTDYPFHIVIHDDCSTDGTREIVERYVAAHPDRIRAIFQSENQFSKGRRILTILLPEMHGTYFALLDGDDFWQSDQKLQVQADFLQANSRCAICQTKTVYFDEALGRVQSIFPADKHRLNRQGVAELAMGNFLQTSAVMFRAAAVPEFPADFDELPFGDYAFFGLLSQVGFYGLLSRVGWIGFIDREMATYRIHGTNLWVNKDEHERIEATWTVLRFLARHSNARYRKLWSDAAKGKYLYPEPNPGPTKRRPRKRFLNRLASALFGRRRSRTSE